MDNNKEIVNETVTKPDKENKEYKRRMSRQTVMTVCMICVSIFVISIATYAWYLITNTPKVTEMEFTADTVGDLLICNTETGTYSTYIPLNDDDSGLNAYLSPVTTANGVTFYRPLYNEGKVINVQLLDTSDDKQDKLLHTKYVYERTFYLKAGDDSVQVANAPKYYDIYLVGKTSTSTQEDSGSYMYTKETDDTTDAKTIDPTDGDAENALRVSFEFDAAHTYEKKDGAYVTTVSTNTGTASNNIVKIYEPNYDVSNTAVSPDDTNQAASPNRALIEIGSTSNSVLQDYTTTLYDTIKQLKNKSFKLTGAIASSKIPANYEDGEEAKSTRLCTIKENEPVKVTMRIWIEGSDPDCVNDIAADQIYGQIQFISEENFYHIEEQVTTAP